MLHGRPQQRLPVHRASPQPPPWSQPHGQAQRGGRLVVQSPDHGMAGDGLFGVKPPGGGQFAGCTLHAGQGLVHHADGIPGHRGPGLLEFPGILQPIKAISTQGFQHEITGPAVRPDPGRCQQGTVHQPQHGWPCVLPGDRFGGFQRERSRKYRDPPEHPTISFAEQLIAPVGGGGERAMPGGGRFPVRSSQQHEPVIQAVQQLRQPECLYPRGGQLDRQRHPVQLGYQLCHRRGGVGAERELPVGAAGPVGEQRHRLGARNSGRIIRRGQRQGGQPVPGLAGNAERLTAGRQDPHVIGDLEQRRAHLGGRPGHVLTAVQHEQHLLPGRASRPANPSPRRQAARERPARLPWPQVSARDPAPLPAPPATRRRRTGRPLAPRLRRPAASSPPRPARLPSRAGIHEKASYLVRRACPADEPR